MTVPNANASPAALESGMARVPRQKQASCCTWGRQFQLLPIYASALSCCISGGVAIDEGVKKNWVGVALSAFVFVTLIIVSICYYRDIPIKSMEDSEDDMEKDNSALRQRIAELEKIHEADQKTVEQFQKSVADAQATATSSKADADKATSDLQAKINAMNQYKDDADRLQKVLTQYQGILTALTSKLAPLAQGNEALKKILVDLGDRIQKLNQVIVSDAQVLHQDNVEMSDEVAQSKKIIDQFGSIVDTVMPTLQANQQLTKQVEDMKAENGQLQAMNAQLKKAIESEEQIKILLANLQDPKKAAALKEIAKAP